MKCQASFLQFIAFVFACCILFSTVHNGVVLRATQQELAIFRDSVNRDHSQALSRLKNVESFIEAQVQARIETLTAR